MNFSRTEAVLQSRRKEKAFWRYPLDEAMIKKE
jgi:hypothetical protein